MIKAMRRMFGFTDEEIGEGPLIEGRLLSMELEFSSRCNLRCHYCYAGKDMFRDNELELEEIYDIISQAKALGARKIVYLGAGEPLLDNKLRDVVNYVYKLGLEHVLFTNATLINADIARFLYRHNVAVVVKYTSMRKEVYEHLCGVEGAYDDMIHGMDCLFDAGYPGKENRMGIEAIISNDNIAEMSTMWRWARTRGILPYFECLTYQGSVKNHGELYPSRERMRAVFEELAEIDSKEFGLRWPAHPPIAAFACKRHLYSCLVNSQGYVQPCVGVGIKVGSIRLEKLADIL
jgi:MoaA/NifB/PqqE/SkfB family radical SAM enzyme